MNTPTEQDKQRAAQLREAADIIEQGLKWEAQKYIGSSEFVDPGTGSVLGYLSAGFAIRRAPMKTKELIEQIKQAHEVAISAHSRALCIEVIRHLERLEAMREALELVHSLQKEGEIWSVDPLNFKTFKRKAMEALAQEEKE